jgi:hypothetical protein
MASMGMDKIIPKAPMPNRQNKATIAANGLILTRSSTTLGVIILVNSKGIFAPVILEVFNFIGIL